MINIDVTPGAPVTRIPPMSREQIAALRAKFAANQSSSPATQTTGAVRTLPPPAIIPADYDPDRSPDSPKTGGCCGRPRLNNKV